MLTRAEDPVATPSVCLKNLLLNIKRFFVGYVKQITKTILKDLREILTQTINTNINGFVQWNISK